MLAVPVGTCRKRVRACNRSGKVPSMTSFPGRGVTNSIDNPHGCLRDLNSFCETELRKERSKAPRSPDFRGYLKPPVV